MKKIISRALKKIIKDFDRFIITKLQSQVQQASSGYSAGLGIGGAEALGSAYAQNQLGQTQGATGQVQPGQYQNAYGQVQPGQFQNPYGSPYMQAQGYSAGVPMEGRRYLGAYGYGKCHKC